MATAEAHANVRDKDTLMVSLSAPSITPTSSPNALVKSAQHSYATQKRLTRVPSHKHEGSTALMHSLMRRRPNEARSQCGLNCKVSESISVYRESRYVQFWEFV